MSARTHSWGEIPLRAALAVGAVLVAYTGADNALGGIWLGVAFVLLGGAVWLNAFRSAVGAACVLAFFGGLARFTSMNLDELLSNGLAAPLAAELIVLPILGVCALRVGAATSAQRMLGGPSTRAAI